MEYYTTPEGHELAQPLLLPDARTFAEVLEYAGEWDHDHRPDVEPSYIGADGAGAQFVRSVAELAGLPADAPGARNGVGPFCTITRIPPALPARRSIAVRALPATLEAVAPRLVTPDDHLSWSIHEHDRTGRALVVLQHGYIIGSHYVAYIDPESLPAYPFAERDRRSSEIHAAMQEAGLRPVRYTHSEPHYREFRNGHAAPASDRWRVVIAPDGTVSREWGDGDTYHEPATVPGTSRNV